jgi:hypothetical protein
LTAFRSIVDQPSGARISRIFCADFAASRAITPRVLIRCRACHHVAKITAWLQPGQKLRCSKCDRVFVFGPNARRPWRYRPKPKRKPITLKQRAFDFDAAG